jgi:hypothetical protein
MIRLSNNIGAVRFLNAVLFSLNIGFALAFALRTYLDLIRGGWLAEILYGEINRIFHYSHWSHFGLVVVFAVVMFVAAETVLLLLLLIMQSGHSALTRATFDPAACILALAAAPACWISSIVIGWPPSNRWNVYPAFPGLHGFWFLGIEVSSVLVLLYAARRLHRPFLYSVVILTAHYSLWAWYMWPAIIEDLQWHPVLQASAVVCPCSGLAWLLYSTALRVHQNDKQIPALRNDSVR